MSHKPLRLAVVIGSARDGRYGPTVAHWFVQEAEAYGQFEVDVIDVAKLELPVSMADGVENTDTHKTLARQLAATDAFVFVTPEYNHSYPAGLKNVIDWFHSEWHAKPVGFISYGAKSGGIRATEHLRPVFSELHAMTVRDAPSFPNVWETFGEDGQPRDAEDAAGAAKSLLGQLEWWGTALRQAREQRPYPG